MKVIHERFASKPWASLCEDAIGWAEEGHPVSSFEYGIYAHDIDELTYYPQSRQFFMPEGRLVPVGERFGSKDMAKTLRRVAAEGPDYMISGGWADEFIATANRMGWNINKAHMTETPPRWLEPRRFRHHEHEIVSFALPQYQGAFCATVLGILRHLNIRSVAPLSAEHIFYMSHALRWALYHNTYLGDPVVADYAVEQLLDDNLHASVARLIAGMRPRIDLSEHVRLTHSPSGVAGWPTGREDAPAKSSTCELSIVDLQGNWVQMTHTLQAGGIPGMVIGGIPMHGSDTSFGGLQGVKLIAGTRMRRALGSTMVLRDGRPAYSLGTPGNLYFTIPQVLTNLLDFRQEPYAAIDAPRMEPLNEAGAVTMEDRISPDVVAKLQAMGTGVQALPPYQYQMGSYQMCFRDERTGELCATTDPRRGGVADGISARSRSSA